ncbi:MAG: DUF4091 domain-containing protein, partial [Verrucomicrobia bacterium]|nr:DUF4091 domain-containing protein [Verrucomicrobiota bacterium]
LDEAEIQLQPFKGKEDWWMFIGSPLGARFDLSSQSSADYNPDWQCVAGRFEERHASPKPTGEGGPVSPKPLGEGGWTLEEKIPFGELAQEGQVFATPQLGEGWRIQFYRKKDKLREVSSWVLDRAGPEMNCRFCGPKGQTPRHAPARISVKFPLLDRAGTMELVVEGSRAPIEGKCIIFLEDTSIDKLESKLPAPGEGAQRLEFPYRLTKDGRYRFKFDLASAGRVVYSGQAAIKLEPLDQMLPAVETEIDAGRKALSKAHYPRFVTLRESLDTFAGKLAKAKEQLKQSKDLTAEGWRALTEQCRVLPQEWKSLSYDLNLARLYPGRDGKPPIPFVVGTATEGDKIYRDTQYQGSLGKPIRFALAGNEYGSVQLAVIPFWQDLKEVTVSFSSLKGPSGKVIPPENARWFRVDYVKLEKPPDWSQIKQYEHAREPDPLLPPKPFNVTAGTVGVVWVDVLMPEGVSEGRFTGEVTITAGEYSVFRKLEVKSQGFDIPKRSSLEIDCWFQPNWAWAPFYGYGRFKYTPELHARHAEILGRYRISSFLCDDSFLCQQVPIYAEPDGRFTFDWSTFDRYVENALKNNSTAFWCNLSCHSGWTSYLNRPDTPVIDRATGKQVAIAKYMQAKWEELKETGPATAVRLLGKAQYDNPIYRDFLVAYVKHLKELGINDCSYYELFDEANQDAAPYSHWLAMIEHHQFFRKLVPDLRIMFLGADPTVRLSDKSALGLVNVWGPQIDRLRDAAVHQAILERRRKHGEKFWMYTCGERYPWERGGKEPATKDPDGNYTPFVKYHRPYLSARMHGWMAWHFQVDGLHINCLNERSAANEKTSPETRWPNTQWSDNGRQGGGTLIYPGPDFELVPGMRLANIRKGLEDYEYFVLLKKEAAKLAPSRHEKLLKDVNAILQIEPAILSSVYKWTKDRSLLETKRDRLAELIREVRRVNN